VSCRAETVEAGRILDEGLDGFLSLANGFNGSEWLGKPATQETRTHRRGCFIQRAVRAKRSAGIVVERLKNLQMPQCV